MATHSGRFTKGDPRINRKGRPKVGQSLTEKFQDALAERLNGDYTKLDSVIDAIVAKALKGDLSAADWLISRGYGKVADRVEFTPKQEFDLSKLSDEELAQLEEIQKKAGRKES